MSIVRLGVIGAGLIWVREHRKALAQLSEVFQPVAFCEVNAERRAALAQDFPTATIVEQPEPLLQREDIDAVLVLTPITLNAPVAMAALQAGKHVIMEKPIARSAAEAQTLARTAQQLGKRLFVAEQMAYRPSNQTIADTLDSGVIGDIVLWDCIRHFAVDPDPAQGDLRYDSTPWRKNPDFPLGTMFDGGIHLVAILSSLFGQPTAASANGHKLREGYGDYDQVVAFLQYANGTSGHLSFSQWMPPMQNHFHIHGTRGILMIEPTQLIVQRKDQPDQIVPLPEGDGRMAMWRAFAAAFQDGSTPIYTPQRAIQDVALLEAINHAIKLGQRQLVE